MADHPAKTIQYLTEAHATELALVRTLQAHVTMTPRGDYRALLERHLGETREQASAIERRLGELGEGRNVLESTLDATIALAQGILGQALALSKGPIDVIRGHGAEEKLLKNAKDECATEALEIATYDGLERLARRFGDEETAELAVRHRRQEEQMLADLRAMIPTLVDAVVGSTGESSSADGADEADGSEPWPGYDAQSAQEVRRRLEGAGPDLVERVREYERDNRNRTSVLRVVQA
jgi:ferritin-like metal-binding protein YciE